MLGSSATRIFELNDSYILFHSLLYKCVLSWRPNRPARPLLLIHLYAALPITKSQTFGLIVFFCVTILHGSAHVWSSSPDRSRDCVGCMGSSNPLPFFVLINESFATTGAAYVMCLCLKLKCKSVHCLSACSSPTFHCEAQQGRYLLVTYLHVYKMGSSACLNC